MAEPGSLDSHSRTPTRLAFWDMRERVHNWILCGEKINE